MTKEELEAIGARARDAIRGPFAVSLDGVDLRVEALAYPGGSMSMADVEFYEHARADVLVLLAYVAELEAKARDLAGERDFAFRELEDFRRRHLGNGCGK